MADWTRFRTLTTLLDVTCSQINAGATVQSPESGSTSVNTSNIQITPNTISSTHLPNGYVADARIIEIISPVDNSAATTQFPDVEISIVNGSNNLNNFIVIDGSFLANMFARRKNTHGSRQIILGFPVRDLLLQNLKHPGTVRNMPLQMTGIKVTDGLYVQVKSISGWGNNGNVVAPLRIVVKGEKYQADDLTGLGIGYDGSIAVSYPGVQEFFSSHILSGTLGITSWGSLPGGDNQVGNVKVRRRISYAYNQQATGTSSPYVFSRLGVVGGNQANIVDTQHDLGDDFSQSNDMFLWQQLGVRIPSGQAYVGFKVGNEIVPQDSPQGAPISYRFNDFQYGVADPQNANSGVYYALAEADTLAQMMVYKNSVSPFIATTGTQSYAVNTASIAKSGILVSNK